jgi:hypothetical protein
VSTDPKFLFDIVSNRRAGFIGRGLSATKTAINLLSEEELHALRSSPVALARQLSLSNSVDAVQFGAGRPELWLLHEENGPLFADKLLERRVKTLARHAPQPLRGLVLAKSVGELLFGQTGPVLVRAGFQEPQYGQSVELVLFLCFTTVS